LGDVGVLIRLQFFAEEQCAGPDKLGGADFIVPPVGGLKVVADPKPEGSMTAIEEQLAVGR
jgi:hypothetical protein